MSNQDDNFSRLFDEDYYRQLENEIKNHGKGNPPTPPVNSKEKTEIKLKINHNVIGKNFDFLLNGEVTNDMINKEEFDIN